MTNELAPDGPELQPDGMGDFGAEEAGSEEAAHLLPPIRELPGEREFLPAAYYSIQVASGTPGGAQLSEVLGQGLFQSLTDVHLFGRNGDSEPWIEAGPLTPEPAQLLIAQEMLTTAGEPVSAEDLEMFEMVASRIAKTLKREKLPPTEDAGSAAARAAGLAALKGSFADRFGISLAGTFDAAQIADCCLSLGIKRDGDRFVWHGGRATAQPVFEVSADGIALSPGASGNSNRVALSYVVASVTQPGKVLERMFAAGYYLTKRMGGEIRMLDGSAPPEGAARGEHPALEAILKKVTDAGLRPGHPVTRRLI